VIAYLAVYCINFKYDESIVFFSKLDATSNELPHDLIVGMEEEDQFRIVQGHHRFEIYPLIYYFGQIPNSKIAKEVAYKAWCDRFGKDKTANWFPFSAYYDAKMDIWNVIGTFNPPASEDSGDNPAWFGGEPHLLVRGRDGKLLSIWATK
jgi:hypothetical protein